MESMESTRTSGDELNSGYLHESHPTTEPSQITEDKEISDELKRVMEFDSEEIAYNYYVEYAKKVGFVVRVKDKKYNKQGFVKRVIYVCNREGCKRSCVDASFRRPAFRIGCQARLICRLAKSGKLQIESFNAIHNHDLVKTPMKHMLKSNRSIAEAQKAHAKDVDKSGAVELMSRDVGGRENLGSLDKDYWNYIHRKRQINMEKGDAGAIVQYFQKKMADDSSYYYAFDLDDDDMITNIFWADARSRSDYGLYGDVVCFDTTYQINEYGRPFAQFLGVNHHKQTVIFGAALLYDETAASFKWLFETFLEAMPNKKPPKTILTDQSAAMAKAIKEVFLDQTHHRLCVWHIYQNGAKNLSHLFQASKEFTSDFAKCVYEFESEDEWLSAWDTMLDMYDLKKNTWLASLFDLRKKWALVYGRHTFTADMMTTQRSESMNHVLKYYLKRGHDLLRFFEHYEKLLEDKRYKELLADFKMMQTSPNLVVEVEILQHALDVYTPAIFTLFQSEYTRSLNYKVFKVGKNDGITEYKVSCLGKSREHVVKFEASTESVTCSCMKFPFIGILCCHALKVLDKKNVSKIPEEYIMKRWTRQAKGRSINNYHAPSGDPKECIGKRYIHLCHNFREVASLAAEDEKLTAYAHENSIQLLEDLEEMRRDIFKDKKCDSGNSESEDELASEPQSERMPRGVKRKATVGLPKGSGRIKPGMEKGQHSSQTTPSARKRLLMKDSFPTRANSEVADKAPTTILAISIDQESQVIATSDTVGETTNVQDEMLISETGSYDAL